MKKKIISLCLVVALGATAVIGGTLAYFTDTDDDITNTFTIGDVEIDLFESYVSRGNSLDHAERVPEGMYPEFVSGQDHTDEEIKAASEKYDDYTINGVPGTLTYGGIIKLKAGATAEIDFPVGVEYTITENLGEWENDYVVKVGGVETNTVSGTVPVGGAAVTFTNTYKKHLADLTITKIVTGEEKPDQNFRFLVSGPDGLNMVVDIRAEAFVKGSGSVTIKDLSQGKYTVTEDTSWAWRYELAEGEEAQKPVTVDNDGGEVTFTNVRTEDQWLDGETWCRNIFDGTVHVAGDATVAEVKKPEEETVEET